MVTLAHRALGRSWALAARSLAMSPVVRDWAEARYAGRLVRHAGNLPVLSSDDVELVADLQRDYVAARPCLPPDDVLRSAERLVDGLRRTATLESCLRVSPADHAADPTVFAWGLHPGMLDLAECYIGLQVRYLGVEVKRELRHAVGQLDSVSRRWHTDHEDRRMLKVIVYLSDVDVHSGPFEYLDRPCAERRQLTGPRLTAVYADTSKLLHRVKAPLMADRYSMTFVYSSTAPFYAYPDFMLPRKALTCLRDQLSDRQQRALTTV